MASAIGVMARMLFAAAFVAASPDPLAQWLDSLKFSLEDVPERWFVNWRVMDIGERARE